MAMLAAAKRATPTRVFFSRARRAFSTVELSYDCHVSPDHSPSEPLVILHGLFGSKRNWTSLAKSFARELQRPVYALDLRNQGYSPHASPMTYSAMAADVLHFCQSHDLKKISLLGHSMGGKVAMSFALSPHLPPDVLQNLVVVDIAPGSGKMSQEFITYVETMQRIEEMGVHTRKEAESVLEEVEPVSIYVHVLQAMILILHPSLYRTNMFAHFCSPTLSKANRGGRMPLIVIRITRDTRHPLPPQRPPHLPTRRMTTSQATSAFPSSSLRTRFMRSARFLMSLASVRGMGEHCLSKARGVGTSTNTISRSPKSFSRIWS
ncbi:hypothetical protein HGRIS_011064 [Hohenbuehelia grisea]|uniref:AB hydrolase-1 domain-containing protein n=1 Tax=Hohenbuehelia grisea TaxID=104357 RepID=A0ABR3IYV5_9AGAR